MTIPDAGTFLATAPKRTLDSFVDLGLSPQILKAVLAEGYTTPTPIQAQSIPFLLQGRDLLGTAQTGTGKTAAFALPILHRLHQSGPTVRGRIRVLILTPTRELAIQIDDSFKKYGKHTGLRSIAIYGGVNQTPQTRALHTGIDVLIATPGRLLDLMNQGFIDLKTIETFVLDEADRMFDMGFINDVRRIIAKLPVKRQTLLFSATMPDEMRKLASAILTDPITVQVVPQSTRAEQIEQTVYFVEKTNKPDLLCQILKEEAATRVLVFTRTKHGADKLVRHLERTGVRAVAIHGNKTQNARIRALESFRSLATPVLVATDLAARGLDIDNVSHVVNFDLPNEPETYVHRIGRTARAGMSGVALSFCNLEERIYLMAIEKLMRETIPVMENGVRQKALPLPVARGRSTNVPSDRRLARHNAAQSS